MTKPRKLVFLLCFVVFGSAAIHHLNLRSEVIAAQARIIQIGTASGPVGGTISVPIELVSQGDENAVGFSLTFDAAVLSNPVAALGSGATGASFNTNNSQAAQGRFGAALAFPANQKFTAGLRQIMVVTFSIAANANFGATNIGFGDQPVQREVADVTANTLTATYTGGAVTITKGFEADVSPRPDGDNNGTVTITDWVQVGKFVAGLDTPAAGNEFQRADCAPRSSLGDGRISIIDWAQAGRYAAALDPATPAGGPTTAASSLSVATSRRSVVGNQPENQETLQPFSTVRLRQYPKTNNQQSTTASVEIDAAGNENALGFSLVFNSSHWRLLSVKAGRDLDEATLHVNSTQAERGRIGIALAMPVGKAIARGERELLVCEFAPIATRKGLPFSFEFGDIPVQREMADVNANPLTAAFSAEGLEPETLTVEFEGKSANNRLAPAQRISVWGANLAIGIESAQTSEFTTSLAGTRVLVIDSKSNQQFLPLLFVSPDLINCLLPVSMAEGTATLIITNSQGETFRKLIEITERQ
ncbi:MAG TPA: hypothetical protein PLK30_12520 [Blastocatellia bacterium]|nr:hypothetical protein [Blastocatellia bacterium]